MVSSEFRLGEADLVGAWSDIDDFDDWVFELTVEALSAGWVEEDRHVLPDLESVLPGLFLMAIVGSVDRSKLNGFDLVRLLQARERLVAHGQAGSAADTWELAHAVSGDESSDPGRMVEGFEFAADELRPALRITRRAADSRLSLAYDLLERLLRVWELLEDGLIDLPRAR